MTTDQPRQSAGTPAGGQFAAATRRETGLTLVPGEGLPVADILAPELDTARAHLAHLETTALVLREQHAAAVDARRHAATASQARETAGSVAELDFIRETVALEAEVARHDVEVLRTRIAITEDPVTVIAEVHNLHASPDYYQLAKAAPKLVALDVECDAGRLTSHPWRADLRDRLVAELTTSLEVTPRHPAARAWKEQLAVLTDPMRLQRFRVAARHGQANAHQLMDAARRAQSANEAYLAGQGSTAPRLRVV